MSGATSNGRQRQVSLSNEVDLLDEPSVAALREKNAGRVEHAVQLILRVE